LDFLNDELKNRINQKEEILKNKVIELPLEINADYQNSLKEVVLERYSNEISDNYWNLQVFFDFINWNSNFNDYRDKKVLDIKKMVKKKNKRICSNCSKYNFL